MSTDGREFGRQLVSETDAYLDAVVATVEQLPRVVSAYRDAEPCADAVASVRERESDCDRRNRRICGLITDSGPGDVGLARAQVHFNATPLVGLYQRLDDVANAAERAVAELRAMEPDRDSDCLDGLAGMAECAVTAARALRDAMSEFVRVLCAAAESGDVTGAVTTIRTTESRCDDRRTEVIEAAFRGETAADAAAYRALAVQFDRVVDAAEDVTDRLCLCSRNVPRLAVEPHTTR
jgi:hypothetical protein